VLPILLAVLAWMPALAGLGGVVRHGGDGRLRPAIAGLLGIGILGAASTIANFFAPISAAVAMLFWAAGVALFLVRRRWLLEETRNADLVVFALVAIVAVPLAWPRDWMNYDTGLYHLQAVRWMREHAVPLGLAHVHNRLGFNSLFHAAAAALEFFPAAERSVWFANLLPTLFAASAGIVGLRRLLAGDSSFPNLFLSFVLVPVVSSLASYPGLGTDHVAALAAYLSFALWARALEDRPAPGPDASAATLLALVALTVKISSAVLLVGSVAILLWRFRSGAAAHVRKVAPAAISIALPWLARNVALSGCLVFPAAATCVVSEPWAVGPRAARELTAWITSWARKPFLTPEQVLGSWDWLRGWPDLYATDENRVVVTLFAMGMVLWLAVVRATSASLSVLWAIAAAGVAYWFLNAPSPRFGLAYLYPLALLPLAFGLSQIARPGVRWTSAATAAAILLACSATVRSNCGGRAADECTAFLRSPSGKQARSWLPWLQWPRLDFAVTLEPRPLRSGQTAYVATPGQQCWDSPLPCTPYLDPDLVWIGNRFEVRRPLAAPAPSSQH
jgi:hypothetical protein